MFLLLLLGVLLGSSPSAHAAAVTLQWDPSADVSVVGYRVHVGTAPARYDRVFDAGSSNRFVFTDAQPGITYYFAVAAYTRDGQVSHLSPEIRGAASAAPANSLHTSARPGCGDPSVCFHVRPLARVGSKPSSLVSTDDGQLFFIEEGRHIRSVRGGVLTPEPVLSVDGPGEAFTSLALAADFKASGEFFVGRRLQTHRGDQLTIEKLRLVQQILATPVSTMAPLLVPEVGGTPLAVDSDGQVHVAIPQTVTRDPYAARVLRFSADGSVPHDNRAGSAILAHGYALPEALAFDRDGRLWLGGRRSPWPAPVANLSPTAPAGPQWPAVPTTHPIVNGGATIDDVIALSASDALFIVAAAPDGSTELVRAPLGGDTGTEAVRIPLDGYGDPVAVSASGAGGLVYVIVREPGSADRHILLELRGGVRPVSLR